MEDQCAYEQVKPLKQNLQSTCHPHWLIETSQPLLINAGLYFSSLITFLILNHFTFAANFLSLVYYIHMHVKKKMYFKSCRVHTTSCPLRAVVQLSTSCLRVDSARANVSSPQFALIEATQSLFACSQHDMTFVHGELWF